MTPIVDRYGRAFAEARTVMEGELAYAVSMVANRAQELYSENDIVRKVGLAHFRGMETRNDVVSSAKQTRTRRLLLRGWDILPASDDAADLIARDKVKLALERMDGSFKDDLAEILDAVYYGFALLEIVWEPWESEWGTLWGIKALKALLQENFRIVGDSHANVVEFVQTTPARQVIPREKVVYAQHRGRPGDVYGGPVYANVYWVDFFLRNVQQFWLLAAERFGSPTVKITHPRALGPSTRSDVERLLSEIGNATALAFSEDLAVDLLEASQGRMTYEQFTQRMEQRIRIAILGQTMTSEAPKTGTQALGTVQERELDAIVEDDREWLETVVNDEIVRRWCLVNLPELGALPRFVILPGKVDPDTLMRRSEHAKKIGLSVSRVWLQEESGIPAAEDDEDELAGPPEPKPFPFSESANPAGSWRDRNVAPTSGNDSVLFADDSAWTAFAADPDGAWWRAFSEFESPRVMRGIERVSRELFDGVRTEARDIWKAIRDDLVRQVEKAGAIESGKMPKLSPRMTAWDGLIKRVWLTAHLDGRLTAVDEIGAAVGFSGRGPTGMSGLPENETGPTGMSGLPEDETAIRFAEELKTDVPSLDDAKAWFVGRVPMTDAEYRRIVTSAGNNAFYITTRESQEASAQVLDALKQALDHDWGLPEFRRDVERRFRVWTGDVFGSAAPKTIAQADARLATVFRTNIMSALSRGRDAMFARAEDPELASDPIVAYEYSAVMDAATRVTHAAMDGLIFAAQDPIWQVWTLPAGYNCRCVRIPILASQAGRIAADALSTNAPSIGGAPVEPDAGFGRQRFSASAATIRFAEDVTTVYLPWLAAA